MISSPQREVKMPEIKLYQFAGLEGLESGSPFCIKVHRALCAKGLDYAVQNVGSPSEMKRINPGKSKVPVLEYDGEMTVDSTCIIELLEEKHPEPALLPAEPAARARVRLLEEWADEALYWFPVYLRWQDDANFQVLVRAFFSKLPIPMRWFVPGMVRKGVLRTLRGQGLGLEPQSRVLEMLEEHCLMLETLLGDEAYLTGDALTAADLAVFGPMAALRAKVTPQGRELLGQHPRLLSWLEAVDEATTGEHTVAVE